MPIFPEFCSLNFLAVLLFFVCFMGNLNCSKGKLNLESDNKIDPLLLEKLERGEEFNVIVSVRETLKGASARSNLDLDLTVEGLEKSDARRHNSRPARIERVTQFYKARTSELQGDLLKFIVQEKEKGRSEKTSESKHNDVTPLWLSSQIVIRRANFDLVQKLRQRSDVSKIEEDKEFEFQFAPFVPIPENGNFNMIKARSENDVVWASEAMEVDKVWATGNQGHGIVVASIDSGVRLSHETLSANHRRSHGWFDAVNGQLIPYDDNGHGTSTMSLAVGTIHDIGVAPSATWISCKALSASNRGSMSEFLKCGEWILCPTDPAGQNADCSKAPHIVNNSWQIPDSRFFDHVITAWRAAGIIPIFAVGNNGVQAPCGTIGNPGSSPDVISVGATNINDVLSAFSSRGPTANGQIKPDIVGPGEDVIGAFGLTDQSYVFVSGTSYSSPHVAGLVALILSEFGDVTFDQVRQLLIDGATPHNYTKGRSEICGGIPETSYPNNEVGYGRVNAANSVLKLTPDWEFKCIREGYFIHRQNPRFYTLCMKVFNSQGQGREFQRTNFKCSKGQHFNRQRTLCVSSQQQNRLF